MIFVLPLKNTEKKNWIAFSMLKPELTSFLNQSWSSMKVCMEWLIEYQTAFLTPMWLVDSDERRGWKLIQWKLDFKYVFLHWWVSLLEIWSHVYCFAPFSIKFLHLNICWELSLFFEKIQFEVIRKFGLKTCSFFYDITLGFGVHR